VDDPSNPGSPLDAGLPTPESDTARGAHLGFVAHEVRNPMSTALWTAELLERMSPEDRGGARGARLTALCFRSLTRVRLLVEDHLLCERLDAGGYPVRPERLVLAEVVEGVVARLAAGGPPVERSVAPDLLVRADRQLLERALDGLLGAAGRQADTIRLAAASRGGAGTVEVRVVGGPVGPLDDPHKGTPSDQRGRALALPMARRVAVAIQGALTADGEGYRLSIPAA